jgi:hypothetical protein
MTTIITSGADTLNPTMVLGYSSSRLAGNIIHPVLGREDPDVTMRPAGLRTGTLELLFTGETDGKEAEDLHSTTAVFTLTSTDRPSINMSYVAAGRIGRELDPDTRDVWVVRIEFQEVIL